MTQTETHHYRCIEATDTPTLIKFADAGRRRGYNRQLSDEFLKTLDWNGTHMVDYAIPHEHIGGKEVELHMRVRMHTKTIDSTEAVTVIFDLSLDDYASLDDHQLVFEDGKWRNA